MPLAATARPLEPLTADPSSPLPAVSPPAAARRRECRVPRVTTLAGADAIALLRAGGFIAAIERAPSELAEGTVIEQYPQAGILLGRDAVVALRLAVPRTAAPEVVGGADPEPSGANVEPAGEDDTELWFAALARPDDARRTERSRPRRRKHRVSSHRAHEFAFDPAPAPIPWVKPAPAAVTSSTRIGRDFSVRSLLASAVCVLPANLAGTTWRRGTVLFAALLLLALLGTRFLIAGDRRQRSSHARDSARTVGVQLIARVSPRPLVHRAAPPARRVLGARRTTRGVRARRRAARPVDRISNPQPPAVEATPARSQDRSPAAAATAANAVAPADGQFAYLGR